MKKVIIDGVLRREHGSNRSSSCCTGTTQPQFMYTNQDQHRHFGGINSTPVAPDCCNNFSNASSQFGTAFGHAATPRSACSQGSSFNVDAGCWGHTAPSNSGHHGTTSYSGHHYNIGHHSTPNTSGHDMGHHMPAPDIG